MSLTWMRDKRRQKQAAGRKDRVWETLTDGYADILYSTQEREDSGGWVIGERGGGGAGHK